jgi:hypothetical protein
MLLQQWWSSYWHIGDDERPSNFEPGKIRKLLVKTTPIKNQGSKK